MERYTYHDTEHFTIISRTYMFSLGAIKEFLGEAESIFQLVSTKLEILNRIQIKYHFIDDIKFLSNLTHIKNPKNITVITDHVYHLYEKNSKMEIEAIIKAICFSIGQPESLLLSNGIAGYFTKPIDEPNNITLVSHFLKNGRYITINELSNNKHYITHNPYDALHIAGAFSEYLITNYGLEYYKKLYSNSTRKIKKTLIEDLGMSIDKIDKAFVDWIVVSSIV